MVLEVEKVFRVSIPAKFSNKVVTPQIFAHIVIDISIESQLISTLTIDQVQTQSPALRFRRCLVSATKSRTRALVCRNLCS